eukprot:TRINITY_DN2502_c0_g1_i2.p1 TRINITY_DN2502_c0_g1~~TRINITY_DN2502_c0_g1_i2.p1  ORF type:complete len:202 (-),score=32.54 TRINITY_DN2502_c0_g1_i2:16-621(-)
MRGQDIFQLWPIVVDGILVMACKKGGDVVDTEVKYLHKVAGDDFDKLYSTYVKDGGAWVLEDKEAAPDQIALAYPDLFPLTQLDSLSASNEADFPAYMMDPPQHRIVGMICLQKEGDIGVIRRFFLRRDYQGQGLGSKMFSVLEDFAKKQALVQLKLDTLSFYPVVQMYQKLGFKLTKSEYWASGVDTVYLEKDLTVKPNL